MADGGEVIFKREGLVLSHTTGAIHDFYQIDPHLFSPAVIRFLNIDTGRVHNFGRVAPDILVESFGI